MTVAAILLYNLSLLAGTAWLIGWHGWSPWWMLFALILVVYKVNAKGGKDEG